MTKQDKWKNRSWKVPTSGGRPLWLMTYYKILDRTTKSSHPAYKNYGGRGIECRITPEEIMHIWFRDEAFKLKKPTIDRVDVNGHYEFNNCRYIERSENAKTKRVNVLCPRKHSPPIFKQEMRFCKKTGRSYSCRFCPKCKKINDSNRYHRNLTERRKP